MQADPSLWQLCHGPFQQTPLDPIHERAAITPDIPSRNPSRLSLSLSKAASAEKDFEEALPSVSSKSASSTSREDLPEAVSESELDAQLDTDLPSTLDLSSALSDLTMKEKAFASLVLGSPRNPEIVWEGQNQRSDSLQIEDDSYLDLQGNKLTTFRKGTFLADVLTDNSSEDPESNDKLQALIVAQDYHHVLTERDYDDHAQLEAEIEPKDQDLTPRPLSWRKESSGSLPAQASQGPPMIPSSSSEQRKAVRKMGSWVNDKLRTAPHLHLREKSASSSGMPSQSQVPGSGADRLLNKDARLGNIIQYSKNVVSRKIQRRESESREPLVITSPLPQHPAQLPSDSSLSAAPIQLVTPLFRLPGGLLIVRQLPASPPRPVTADDGDVSQTSDISWPDFPGSPPFRFDFLRRGSWHSEPSRVASTVAGNQNLRSSIGSPSSLGSFCYSPSSPVTQETPLPYSPPRSRYRSHNVITHLASPPPSRGLQQSTESPIEEVSHKLNLFEKARNARDAWRQHHKTLKDEKLKQSIRLVGPTDATGIAGYIKFDGRASGDSGIGEGRLSEHIS